MGSSPHPVLLIQFELFKLLCIWENKWYFLARQRRFADPTNQEHPDDGFGRNSCQG